MLEALCWGTSKVLPSLTFGFSCMMLGSGRWCPTAPHTSHLFSPSKGIQKAGAFTVNVTKQMEMKQHLIMLCICRARWTQVISLTTSVNGPTVITSSGEGGITPGFTLLPQEKGGLFRHPVSQPSGSDAHPFLQTQRTSPMPDLAPGSSHTDTLPQWGDHNKHSDM